MSRHTKRVLAVAAGVLFVAVTLVLAFTPRGETPLLLDAVIDTLHDALGQRWLTFERLEVAANVLLFIPVGVISAAAIPRRWWLLALLPGPLLSFLIEHVQGHYLYGRVGSISDFIANSAGAILGVALVWGIRSIRSGRHHPVYPPASGELMTAPRLVAFDLDDTLAPSKSAIDPRIAQLLLALAERVEVAIISGGNETQFRTQVLEQLPEVDTALLERFHLMPTCGTRYLRWDATDFAPIYAHDLSEDEKSRSVAALREEAERLGLWEAAPWGDIIEDRGSQITFSALGQKAPGDAKHAWDPSGEKRLALRGAVADRLPDLEVRAGGSTSIDITRKGIDKAYGMRELAARTGIALTDMMFYGDRLDEGGNDYPVKAIGVPSIAVTGWEDTAAQLDALLPRL